MKEIIHRSTCEADTLRLGADISLLLMPGDCLALSGDLGAGKSVFARGLIRQLLQNQEEDIASPTYTICNVYDTTPRIAHIDLYRFAGREELDELDIDEILETGCALIEWPERGFEQLPENFVHVVISEAGDRERKLRFSGNESFLCRINRTLRIRDFLNANGYPGVQRRHLEGDASARRYERIVADNDLEWLLMDAPEMPDGPPVRDGKPYSQIAHLAENVSAFVAIAKILRDKHMSAPEIPGMDLDAGLLLVENLGDGKIIDQNRIPVEGRYLASVEFLANLHTHDFPPSVPISEGIKYVIPAYDNDALSIETELLIDWYIPEIIDQPLEPQKLREFFQIWNDLFSELKAQEKTLVLRDFHSPNIIWRGDKAGVDRIGVIDFQDAVIGPIAYDVASLAQDARVDVSEVLEKKLVETYLELRLVGNPHFDKEKFKAGYAIMAAQRATKILGIFCRLNKRDGKPQYLAHIPRISDYLQRSLRHPVLERYRNWLNTVIEL
ncbi:MAG: tRNA (adenosine(37)-N6)-threonylcarbamoyltransferase complex ATPase subunit type 1 TsaE [Rhizobiaceae bacterium]